MTDEQIQRAIEACELLGLGPATATYFWSRTRRRRRRWLA